MDPDILQRANRRTALLMVLVFAVIVIVLPGGDGSWLLVATVIGLPVLLFAIAGAVLLALRRRGVAWLQTDPMWGTDPDRRRRILRAIKVGRSTRVDREELWSSGD